MAANVAVESLLESVEEAISELKGIEPKNQVDHQRCPYQFGYLADLPDDSFIPEECFVCPRVIECMVTSWVKHSANFLKKGGVLRRG